MRACSSNCSMCITASSRALPLVVVLWFRSSKTLYPLSSVATSHALDIGLNSFDMGIHGERLPYELNALLAHGLDRLPERSQQYGEARVQPWDAQTSRVNAVWPVRCRRPRAWAIQFGIPHPHSLCSSQAMVWRCPSQRPLASPGAHPPDSHWPALGVHSRPRCGTIACALSIRSGVVH
jgi:hypothetical protein